MRAAMSKCLAVDLDDARGAIATKHREDLSDPLPREIRLAAPEETGRDRLVAIEEEKGLGIAALEMLSHALSLVRVEECETRFTGAGVPKKRAQPFVAREIDAPIGVGLGMSVIG